MSVLPLALDWTAKGRKVAIATVIETWGSAPQPVGSQLLIPILAAWMQMKHTQMSGDRCATSSNPAAFIWDKSIRMPRRLHNRTRSLPASVSPRPMSGLPGNFIGTP